jgi:HSP20 family molecular chaperone IbpA
MTDVADRTGGKTPDYGKNETGNGNMETGNSINTRHIKSIEPETTLLDEGKFLRILTKLPGIAEEKIRIDLEKTLVTISASDTTKVFNKVIVLPCEATFCKKHFSDGELELILEKLCP